VKPQPLRHLQDTVIVGRFLDKVLIPDDGLTTCWPWQGASYPNGYGSFAYQGKVTTAHRVSYLLFVGAVEPKDHVDHLCRNRICVRPTHLESVTERENILRGISPSAKNARRTHCVRGHPLEGDNLGKSKAGRRVCLTCARERMRLVRALRRASSSPEG
jgi:hypothetical protein